MACTWIRIREKRAHGEEDLGDGEGGAPVILEDVQANGTRAVDVTVIDTGPEHDLQVPPRVSMAAGLQRAKEREKSWRTLGGLKG